MHRYAGRMNVGIIANPAALAQPHVLLARLADELDVLAAAALPTPASVAS